MMKVGVSTYSFGKYISELGMIGVLDKIKEFEGEAVDFIPFEKDDHAKALALAAEYKEHMDKIGLLPGCFCVSANFLADDLDAQVRDLCLQADIAKVLGTKMRFDVANGFPANVKVKRSYDSFLESGAVDFVVTGCGTGQGAMLALNSFPGVLCGHITDPTDAYLFAQVNKDS